MQQLAAIEDLKGVMGHDTNYMANLDKTAAMLEKRLAAASPSMSGR